MAQFVVLTVSKQDAVDGYAYTPTAAITSASGGNPNNRANTPWPEVVVDYLNNTRRATGTTAMYAGIDPNWQAALDNGTWFEWEFSIKIDPTETPAQTLARLKADINDQEADIIQTMITRLQYWGFTFDSST